MRRGITRRDFIKASAAVGASFVLPYARVLGANDDIRVAIVGFRSKGKGLLDDFCKKQGVRVVALCDADESVLKFGMADFEKRNEKVAAYTDMRRIMDDKDIDAVVTATPNHWHALTTIWACQAGKDVYVEKPSSQEIWESFRQVEAARKYNRVVQVGMQNRSSGAFRQLLEYIREGHVGAIQCVRGFCYKRRGSIGKVDGPQDPPRSVDYDLWTGPAPMLPLTRRSLHYDWHWLWAYGNGDIGNQGIHEMDLCRWALGVDHLPPRVMSIGGRFGYVDDGQTPNTQIAYCDYQPAPILFEVKGLPMKAPEPGQVGDAEPHYRGVRVGIVIECEEGYYAGGGGGGWVYDKNDQKIQQFTGGGQERHTDNFITAVRNRDVGHLTADILEGHRSSMLFHMANLSHRIGREMKAKQVEKLLDGDPWGTEAFGRFQEHLEANKVNLSKKSKENPLIMGPWLSFDMDKECFAGEFAEEAMSFVRRPAREPFVVPEKV